MSGSSLPLQLRQISGPVDGNDVIYDGDGWYSSVRTQYTTVKSSQDKSSQVLHQWLPRFSPSNEAYLDEQLLTTLQTGYIVKWSIIGAIFLFFALFLLIGYFHAQRRMKKGLRPLAYHRVCLSTNQGHFWCEVGID